jgi:isopropylmalate/homocitrate/citramalate synthase
MKRASELGAPEPPAMPQLRGAPLAPTLPLPVPSRAQLAARGGGPPIEVTVLLPVPLTLGADFKPPALANDIEVRLQANWLVCRRECIPEEGSFALNLPLRSATALHGAAFEAALAAKADEIAIFAAASESFSKRNINCSIAESLVRFAPVAEAAKQAGMRVRGYVSCVLDCPYEGSIAAAQAAEVARRLYQLGCYEVSLGDTIGTGTPHRAQALVDATADHIPRGAIAVHFHDTYGQALANIYACLERGIATVDSSVAGLGGCPYAKGASGNVASEDVRYMLGGLGIATGVDLGALAAAGRFVCHALGRAPTGRVAQALAAKQEEF